MEARGHLVRTRAAITLMIALLAQNTAMGLVPGDPLDGVHTPVTPVAAPVLFNTVVGPGETLDLSGPLYLIEGTLHVLGGGTVRATGTTLLFGSDALILVDPAGSARFTDTTMDVNPLAQEPGYQIRTLPGSTFTMDASHVFNATSLDIASAGAVIQGTRFELLQRGVVVANNAMTITDNVFDGNAIAIDATQADALIANNTILDGGIGIRGNNATLLIENNTIDGPAIGVDLASSESLIQFNFFMDRADPLHKGTQLAGSTAILRCNTFRDWGTAIVAVDSNVTIQCNDIQDSNQAGVDVRGTGTFTSTGDSFEDNRYAIVAQDHGGLTIQDITIRKPTHGGIRTTRVGDTNIDGATLTNGNNKIAFQVMDGQGDVRVANTTASGWTRTLSAVTTGAITVEDAAQSGGVSLVASTTPTSLTIARANVTGNAHGVASAVGGGSVTIRDVNANVWSQAYDLWWVTGSIMMERTSLVHSRSDGGFIANSPPSVTLRNVTFVNTGSTLSYLSGIRIDGGQIALDNVTVSGYGEGLLASPAASTTFKSLNLSKNYRGMDLNGAGPVTILGLRLFDNRDVGLSTSIPVVAKGAWLAGNGVGLEVRQGSGSPPSDLRDSYWGHASGPTYSGNLGGVGDSIVLAGAAPPPLYSPFRTTPPA